MKNLTQTEHLLIRGLKVFEVSKGVSATIFMTLQNEVQMMKMIEYMTEHRNATETELLSQARRIAAA